MSMPNLPLPNDPGEKRKRAGFTTQRIILWIVVGGFGAYLIITGIVGLIIKAR
jgi:hypothetical protein